MPPLGVWLRKDPDSRIPVGIDWTNWLQDNGSLRIVESVWLAPTGITLEGASILPDGTGTAVVVLGGVVSDIPVMLTNKFGVL